MKHQTRFWTQGWTVPLMVLVLAGCGTTPPVKYYTLDPFVDIQAERSPPVARSPLAIGVGPVEFPKLLERRQIVTRKSRYQVDLSDFHRWANVFSDDFLRVLTRNLSTLLPSDRVAAHPWPNWFSPTHRLHLIVERFDGRFGGEVVLNAAWSLRNQATTKPPVIKHARITEAMGGETYDELVAAQSRALETLSRIIADELREIAF